ncbi:MAG TPA: twin-arginine translocation signal domain-containing protein [Stellaceae bacterium]|nr:twin-arginine translocation signal domain-containing protein [Stellaceae bacterium]
MHMTRRSTLTAAGAAGLALVAGIGSAHAEPHPALRSAINALERARNDLQHAAHDFGGHRVEAIQSIDRALEQLRIAMRYDR